MLLLATADLGETRLGKQLSVAYRGHRQPPRTRDSSVSSPSSLEREKVPKVKSPHQRLQHTSLTGLAHNGVVINSSGPPNTVTWRTE